MVFASVVKNDDLLRSSQDIIQAMYIHFEVISIIVNMETNPVVFLR